MVEDDILFTNHLAVIMGLSSARAQCLTSALTLDHQLAVASSNQLKLVSASSVCMTNRNSMACRITSDLDFNKRGCVMQI